MKGLNEARAVIRDHQKQLPVPMVALARDLGLRVFTVPNWPGNLSGMIKKNETNSGGFDIFVNAEHPRVRRRFTIAHEIAHAVLHPDLIGDGITDDALYRSGLSNRVEVQANSFAADILMPWERLNELMDSGVTEIDDLAKAFEVSIEAMSIRLGVPLNRQVGKREIA